MIKIICSVALCILCMCTSTTNIADGSITITTNGLASIENEILYINVNIDDRFELHIKDISGQSILFITGSGPAEFIFSVSAFKPGSYEISVRDINGKVIYTQNLKI